MAELDGEKSSDSLLTRDPFLPGPSRSSRIVRVAAIERARMPLAIVDKVIDREKWTDRKKNSVPRPDNHEILLQSEIRPIAVVAGLFPLFGLISIIVYGYIFQAERLSTYLKTTKCPNITSRLPPVSYPMGIWEPQKFIWLIIIILHTPPRVFYGLTYTRFFLRSESKYVNTWWYRFFVFAYPWITLLEMLSFIMVTVVDQESCFRKKAFGTSSPFDRFQ